jgi:4-amino-4-deoxychorismate lyase
MGEFEMKLLETIKFENGKFANIELHQERINRSWIDLYGSENKIDLVSVLEMFQANSQKSYTNHKIYKCRIVYSKTIQSIELLPYTLPKIKSLKLVLDDSINYNFKFENREKINQLFAKRENCDDILIVKNGLITDTSFCNILFFNGKKWLTPEKPLLKGIKRQLLIDSEIAETANISFSDLHNFTKARLVNAMIGFDDEQDISIKKIL